MRKPARSRKRPSDNTFASLAPDEADELTPQSPQLQPVDSLYASVAPDELSLPSLQPRPVDKIITTYELLENILVQLDTEDLFRVRGVNYNFNSTIETSKTLRQNLFLSPHVYAEPERCMIFHIISSDRVTFTFGVPDEGAEHLHLRAQAGEYIRQEARIRNGSVIRRNHIRQEYHSCTVPIVLNPLVFYSGPMNEDEAYVRHGFANADEKVRCCTIANPSDIPRQLGKMLTTQPPVLELEIRLPIHKWRWGADGWITVRNETGVRLKDVARSLRAHAIAGKVDIRICFKDDQISTVLQSAKRYYQTKCDSNMVELNERLADGQCSQFVDPAFIEWARTNFGMDLDFNEWEQAARKYYSVGHKFRR